MSAETFVTSFAQSRISSSIVPVKTATSSATPTAKPTCRDMFTIPDPSPSSWPAIEPIEPIDTAGKVAPIPAPIRQSGPRTLR